MCDFPANYLAFSGHRQNRFHVEDLREMSCNLSYVPKQNDDSDQGTS